MVNVLVMGFTALGRGISVLRFAELQNCRIVKLSKKGLTNGREHGIVAPRAKVAQLVEHSTENAGVTSSILVLGIPLFGRTV
jgi:hypothetical protein